MDRTEAYRLNGSSLAYIGDAVYELAIREMLMKRGKDAGKMHHDAIRYVSSNGQARAAKKMCNDGFLTEEEEKLLKRARNHRATSKPQNADPRLYKWATGFEALIGFLHLAEDKERLDAVIEEAIRIIRESRNE
ncbi:MAG: ribonuclease III domain-containing protein [Firmicutes bacterium]|nr:ribonuclease III domain-containing protein [Bacillota bacterium]